MDKKKLSVVLFAAVAVVIVLLIVFAVQISGSDSQIKALNDQITEMETAAKNTAAELETAKAAAEEAAREIETAKAAAEEAAREIETVKATAEEAAKAAAQELEAAKAAQQAAEEKAAQTAAELDAMGQKVEEMAAAKEKTESEARLANEQLERIRDAVTGVMSGTATEKDVPIARILYENSDHTVRAYSKDFTDGVTASVRDIEGEGTYTVSLAFDQPAEGLFFMTLCIDNGEVQFPGWVIDVKEVKVNGHAIEVGKTYTSSDDGLRTRVNLFNEWETKLPKDVRAATKNLRDASAVVVNPEDFAAVSAIEITFDYLSPESAAARRAETAAAAE